MVGRCGRPIAGAITLATTGCVLGRIPRLWHIHGLVHGCDGLGVRAIVWVIAIVSVSTSRSATVGEQRDCDYGRNNKGDSAKCGHLTALTKFALESTTYKRSFH